MRKLQMYNELSSGFELIISTTALILTYALYALITLCINVLSDRRVDRLSTAAISNIIVAASADKEVLYVLCYLIILGLVASVKCILCKLLSDNNNKLVCTLFILLSSLSLVIMFAFFTVGLYNDYLIVAVLGFITVCLEMMTIVVNLNFIGQLKYTKEEM